MDILNRLFEESAPTNRLGSNGEEGTGFGSLQVKKYTEMFGGNVYVTSEVGINSGTTFRLEP